jgi:hypothetical protein
LKKINPKTNIKISKIIKTKKKNKVFDQVVENKLNAKNNSINLNNLYNIELTNSN